MTEKPTYEELERLVGQQAREISEIKKAQESGSSQQRGRDNLLEAERKQLLSIFDSIDQIIYVADTETFEILYANPALERAFNRNLIGERCYRAFHRLDSPCDFCTNHIILRNKGKPHQWEHHNSVLGRDYAITDRIIQWSDGRKVRFELAIDITEQKRALQALHESEELYRTVFENTGTATVIIEEDATISMANTGYERLSGYSKGEVEGRMKWTEFVVKEDLGKMVEYHRERRKEKGNVPREYGFRFIDKSGNIKHVWNNVTLIPGSKKSIASLLDITPLKKAEEAIRESEERYRILIEYSNDGIAIVRDGVHLYVNNRFGKIFGYDSPGEIIGRPIDLVIDPDDRTRVAGNAQRRERGEKAPSQYEFKGVRRDGTTVFLEVSAARITYQGAPATLAFFRDVTVRRKEEEERLRLATAIDQSAEAIVITDVNGDIQYVNPAFERITGYTREEAMGQNPRILKSGKHDKTFYEDLWNIIGKGKVWSGHFTNRNRDGELYQEEASISPVKDHSGRIINYVAVKRDVTAEMRMEKQLRQSQKMEAMGTLAGGIAHDFNNILASIMGYAELAGLETPDGSKGADYLESVLKATGRARDLVKQILSFSRQREEDLRPLRMDLIVKEALKLLRASLPSTVEIRGHVDRGLGSVLADPTQIHQVVMNLCTNAAQAMGQAGGVLEVSLHNEELGVKDEDLDLGPGRFLRLTVGDTGAGMAPGVMERIFDPYFTTKEKGLGTGLGLSVVRGIVENCGGTIRVESEPGRGSTFHVYFPVVEEAEGAVEQGPEEPLATGTERILFVDDEPTLADLNRDRLSRLGYEVTTRTSSTEALGLFRATPDDFDLVITDMTMPRMTGESLAREILKIRPDTPIILCTGYSEHISGEKAREIGIRAFAMKPLDMKDLAETVRKVLDGSARF
ncbi:MAG: PAS domain S-box protein [Deltaproteobacteria bacterium]|nr:PAS domain S-box protein [Deltaproteobacteria bacterium]MBW2110820.1 PAS domain S-box protein [Deltaproteobacteria bacterium]